MSGLGVQNGQHRQIYDFWAHLVQFQAQYMRNGYNFWQYYFGETFGKICPFSCISFVVFMAFEWDMRLKIDQNDQIYDFWVHFKHFLAPKPLQPFILPMKYIKGLYILSITPKISTIRNCNNNCLKIVCFIIYLAILANF